MFEDLFIPSDTLLHLTAARLTPEQVEVHLAAVAPATPCPDCEEQPHRVHSHYLRTLADLPLLQRPVCLFLRVRRFFCDNPDCPRRTFCERLPTLISSGARRTVRLHTEQRRLSLDMSAEAAARLAQPQGMSVSPSTLLRFARRDPPPSPPTPRVLGIDDFSFRKGQLFGTILVDLERHQPIELLPDRCADTVAAWLQTHPGVEIISRDRATEYADGARRGAPNAIQVADRFHILENLREAVLRLLEQHIADIQAAHLPAAQPSPATLEPAPETTNGGVVNQEPIADELVEPSAPKNSRERAQAACRAQRLERYTTVRELHASGLSIHEITRQMQISRQSVRRYLRADQFPEIAQRPGNACKLTPFVPYLREQLAAGHDNAAALWRMLREDYGYTGGRSTVTSWVAQNRHLCPQSLSGRQTRPGRRPASEWREPPPPRRRSARQVSWLVVRPAHKLTEDERLLVERLRQACPAVQQGYILGQAFVSLVNTRDHAALDQWLAQVAASGIVELQTFAAGLERDAEAVRVALRLPYSNERVAYCTSLLTKESLSYGSAVALVTAVE